jgi:hypothetical protein
MLVLVACDTALSGHLGGAVGATLEGCPIFPTDNDWNRDISNDPVDPASAAYLGDIGLATGLHADFGSNLDWGLPAVVVPGTQRKLPISFDNASESDPGPYPIPDDVPIERGGDHHALVIDRDACVLYEVYALTGVPGAWHGGSGAVWHLRTNATRPAGWTSADAAGLPIFPGGSSVTPRSKPARFGTHCASPPHAHKLAMSRRPCTTPPARPSRRGRRWGCAFACDGTSTSPAFPPARASS